ncbi:MAG: MFS transporter [Candidatus Puniceispirillum sp. TMED52]|nr:MFS transporter [SAR116 cluster bacterium]OUU46836.1 MAG: MFS transporter [Candidatus Puniceispirillum sp. TMED52]
MLASYFNGYLDRRMLRIFLLGMMSGFPWVLIGSALTLWLKEDGLSRTTVGFAGLIFGVYAFNFLWAPLIDRLSLPWLSRKIGHRKAWIILFQICIFASLLVWIQLDATEHLFWVVGFGLIIAFASASQDIVIDALRIEQAGQDERQVMAAGAAMSVIGWWSGFKLGGLVTFFIADYIQAMGVQNYWQYTFISVLLMIGLMNLGLLLIPEQQRLISANASKQQYSLAMLISWLGETVIDPLVSFFRNNGVRIGLAILGFVFLFKIGEAFMGKMSIVFYREIGFSKSEIGIYSKGLGWVVTIVFTLIGGWFAMRLGTVKALFIAGVAMASTNIMFSLLYWVGKVDWLFALAVMLDDLAAAFATVAFVTFISLLVDRRYTATQYALLASIGTGGKTILSASSGWMVDSLDGDWGIFFIITALMVIPSLLLLILLRREVGTRTKTQT